MRERDKWLGFEWKSVWIYRWMIKMKTVNKRQTNETQHPIFGMRKKLFAFEFSLIYKNRNRFNWNDRSNSVSFTLVISPKICAVVWQTQIECVKFVNFNWHASVFHWCWWRYPQTEFEFIGYKCRKLISTEIFFSERVFK